MIPENTWITAGSNLIPQLGCQFQVDTSEANLKLAGEILIWAYKLVALISISTTSAQPSQLATNPGFI